MPICLYPCIQSSNTWIGGAGMKVLMTYVGTISGFRKWLKVQKPANVLSLREYRERKEQKGGKAKTD